MKHLILFIDALGKSMFTDRNVPRILNFFQQGTFTGVRTLLGYSNAIIPSIFSGAYPSVHNVWGLYKLSPSTTPFSDSKLFPSWLFDRNLIIRYIANKMIFRSAINKGLVPDYMVPANVPIRLLKYFDISMKLNISEANCLGYTPTLFDELRTKGVNFTYFGYPWHKDTEHILDSARKSLESDAKVVVAYIGEIDHHGHMYGINSKQFLNDLRLFDDVCAEFLTNCAQLKNTTIVAFSDHGLRDVSGATDISAILKTLPLEIEKDYIIFLDSTIARFWFHNENARQLIVNALAKSNSGHILSNEEILKYNLNFQSDTYGHSFYLTDPGKVIHPNFYTIRGGTVKAMHGWSPDDNFQDSFFYSNIPVDGRSLTDVTKIYDVLKQTIGV